SGGLLSTALPAPITNVLSGLPGVGSAAIPVVGDPVATVNGVIDTVQGLLSTVLSTALSTLDGLSLLKVSGIELGTKTVAADSVPGSVADIVAKIGGISVGGLSLPGLDLGATAAQVNGVLNTINGTLGS